MLKTLIKIYFLRSTKAVSAISISNGNVNLVISLEASLHVEVEVRS